METDSNMSFEQLLASINPEIYENLKRAVELGKWADDRKLTREQRQLSMQAIIAYDVKNLPPEERSGYVPPKKKASCGPDDNATGEGASPTEQPLKWQ